MTADELKQSILTVKASKATTQQKNDAIRSLIATHNDWIDQIDSLECKPTEVMAVDETMRIRVNQGGLPVGKPKDADLVSITTDERRSRALR